MKYYILNKLVIVVTTVIGGYSSIALSSGEYTFKPGDCLSRVVSVHYPKSAGYDFVLHANPHIVDASKITVGTRIKLPGLTQREINIAEPTTTCETPLRKAMKSNKSDTVVSEHDPTTTSFLKALERWERWAKKTNNTTVLERINIKFVNRTSQHNADNVESTTSDAQLLNVPAQQTNVVDNTDIIATRSLQLTDKPELPFPAFAVNKSNTLAIGLDTDRSDQYIVNAIGAHDNSQLTSIRQSSDASFNVVLGKTNNDDLLVLTTPNVDEWQAVHSSIQEKP